MNTDHIFFTSDLHLSHDNVLGFDKRPFKDIHEHDEAIISNIVDTVPKGGHLWVLGDLFWHNRYNVIEEFCKAMDGQSILWRWVRGNHDDRFWENESINAHQRLEAKWLHHTEAPGRGVYLSHYAHRTWRNAGHGSLHLYGHTHGNIADQGRSMDVGVMNTGYCPVSLTQVIAALGERDIKIPDDHHIRK